MLAGDDHEPERGRGIKQRAADQERPVAEASGEAPGQQPVVRKNFADTALWNATLKTGQDGTAEVSLAMPENLTGWKRPVFLFSRTAATQYAISSSI